MAQRPGLARQYSVAARKTVILVSGGATGLGYDLIKKLAVEHQQTHHILMGCRNTTKGEIAVASMGAPLNVNPIQLDVTSDESVDHCFKTVQQIFGRLDVLIHCAETVTGEDDEGESDGDGDGDGDKGPGTTSAATTATLTLRETYKQVYAVNVIGSVCLTEKLSPLLSLSRQPKVIFTSSDAGSIAGTLDGTVTDTAFSSPSDTSAYNSSKAAINYLCVYFADKYREWKVNASASSPPLGRRDGDGANTAATVANTIRLVLEGSNGATATFTGENGRSIPW